MKKLTSLVVISLVLMGCNDPPLPAFANNAKPCIPSDCSMDYPEPIVHVLNHYNGIDKHYDSVFGHHDFSVEADH